MRIAPAEAGGFYYPLALGNRWDYEGSFEVQTFPVEGPPDDPFVVPSTRRAELICVESRESGEYVVEHTHTEESGPFGPATFDSWVRYRQDRTGLYEADVATSQAPACGDAASGAARTEGSRAAAVARSIGRIAPAKRAAFERAAATLRRKLDMVSALLRHPGVDLAQSAPRPGEITRLAYPLHAGASWVIRDDGFPFVATVEGLESLSLSAGRFTAARIRIEIGDLLGPEDTIHFWFSRHGMLQLVAHLTSEASDDAGNPVGTIVSEQRLVLTGLDLSDPNAF